MGRITFPLEHEHKDVLLKEVVRNSSRIVTASLPFCRSSDLADVTCNHGVRGPPLEPFMFDNCAGDDVKRNVRYVEGILHGLKHMQETFAGTEIHNNLVILVPSVEFKDALLPSLTSAMQMRGVSMVDAVNGAFAEPKKTESAPSRIVLDTLESFDGMERLFVFAVGLDSVKTTEGCCGIYRALTRAHMFVCVVQEHLKGGWLEFTAAVQRDTQVDFDEAKERDRVARDNLAVIAGLKAAAAMRMAGNDGGGTTRKVRGLVHAVKTEFVEVEEHDDDADFEVKDVAAEKSLIITQNVWNANLNAAALCESVSSLSFNPISDLRAASTVEPPVHEPWYDNVLYAHTLRMCGIATFYGTQ